MEFHKRFRNGKNMNRGHSLVSLGKHLNGTWPLHGDSQEREQRGIHGLVWECFAGRGLIDINLLYNLEVYSI